MCLCVCDMEQVHAINSVIEVGSGKRRLRRPCHVGHGIFLGTEFTDGVDLALAYCLFCVCFRCKVQFISIDVY